MVGKETGVDRRLGRRHIEVRRENKTFIYIINIVKFRPAINISIFLLCMSSRHQSEISGARKLETEVEILQIDYPVGLPMQDQVQTPSSMKVRGQRASKVEVLMPRTPYLMQLT